MPATLCASLPATAAALTTLLMLATPVTAKPVASEAGPSTQLQEIRFAGRKSCPLGQHYSTYYRRCVWWGPLKT